MLVDDRFFVFKGFEDVHTRRVICFLEHPGQAFDPADYEVHVLFDVIIDGLELFPRDLAHGQSFHSDLRLEFHRQGRKNTPGVLPREIAHHHSDQPV